MEFAWNNLKKIEILRSRRLTFMNSLEMIEILRVPTLKID